MKKFTAFTLLAMLIITVCSSSTPKKNNVKDIEPIYLFGFSFSFGDSTVYLTDIQLIDSAQVGSHGMLLKRGVFSDQMKNHLTQNGVETPTCVIFFSPNKKEANKQMTKVMKRYQKKNILWKILSSDDFRFTNSLD